ncbi:MBL fold metallo-hydrolase [Streptomyces aureus]
MTGLGYAVDDVRHIVLTHLDLDHAGGLPDFPRARFTSTRPSIRPR